LEEMSAAAQQYYAVACGQDSLHTRELTPMCTAACTLEMVSRMLI